MIIIESIDHISYTVSSLDKSVDFYRDIFGFDVVEKQSGSKEAFLQVGDIMLRLCEGEVSEDERDDNYVCFYVDSEDFDDAMDEVESNDLEVVFGPENIRNGRKVIVADPDGNRIALCCRDK